MKKTRFQRFFYRTKNATVHRLIGEAMSVQDTLLLNYYYCIQPSLHRTQPVVFAKLWRLASMVFLLLYSTSFICRPERYTVVPIRLQNGTTWTSIILCSSVSSQRQQLKIHPYRNNYYRAPAGSYDVFLIFIRHIDRVVLKRVTLQVTKLWKLNM